MLIKAVFLNQVIESFKGTKKKNDEDEAEFKIIHLFSPLSARHKAEKSLIYINICLPPQLILYAIKNLIKALLRLEMNKN